MLRCSQRWRGRCPPLDVAAAGAGGGGLGVGGREGGSGWAGGLRLGSFAVAVARSHLEVLGSSRVLTTDQWGDYLIFRNYPRQRVFVDGRSDFYGPGVGGQYLR